MQCNFVNIEILICLINVMNVLIVVNEIRDPPWLFYFLIGNDPKLCKDWVIK